MIAYHSFLLLSPILSKNIWIPINVNLPKSRIIKILKECQADIVIVDHAKSKKNLFLEIFCNKKKLIFQIFLKLKKQKEKK